jgi:hypothetical protein
LVLRPNTEADGINEYIVNAVRKWINMEAEEPKDARDFISQELELILQLVKTLKSKEEKKGYRLPTESEKWDDKLRDGLKTVRGTKKYHPPRE